MNTEERQRIYEAALDAWDVKDQAMKCCEECAELIQAIMKFFLFGRPKNKEKHRNNVIEEVADVMVTTKQIIISLDIEQEVEDQIDKKLKRVEGKLIDQGHFYDPDRDREIL